MSPDRPEYDILVVGAGLTGLAAGLFAADRGLTTAVCGGSSGLDFCSGLIDLLGVHPLAEARVREDPWAGLEALWRDRPDHPSALLGRAGIEAALARFSAFMAAQGLPYVHEPGRNSLVMTPVGTIKPSYLIPGSVWPGVRARNRKAPTLIVGFEGLKGFSARQIATALETGWPGLESIRIPFPGKTGELFPEHLARALLDPAVGTALVEALADRSEKVEYLGFPAILGLDRPEAVVARLEELTGKRVFEIPTLPPGLAGARLKSAFGRGLRELGVDLLINRKVIRTEQLSEGWLLEMDRGRVGARAVILAAGRFLGQGLVAERNAVREPIFGLPVTQPESREGWTRPGFFDPPGQPIFSAGIATDPFLRPLDRTGRPVSERLFAAGAILAGNDWTRRLSGGGLALATARKAADGLAQALKGGRS